MPNNAFKTATPPIKKYSFLVNLFSWIFPKFLIIWFANRNKNGFFSRVAEKNGIVLTKHLFEAINKRDSNTVNNMLLNRNLETFQEKGPQTLLVVATSTNNISIVTLLLSKGANPNHVIQNIPTNYNNLDISKYSTPLEIAVANENTLLISLLYEKGADINYKDPLCNGATPLHLAVLHNKLYSVQTLLEKGSDVTIRDDDQNTPLHLAIQYARLSIVKELINCKYIIPKNPRTPLENWSPLHLAIKFESISTIPFLANLDNLNHMDSIHGDTPLHFAIRISNDVKIIETLITEGSNIELKNKDSDTPLQLAIKLKKTEVVRLLLKNGTIIYQEDLNLVKQSDSYDYDDPIYKIRNLIESPPIPRNTSKVTFSANDTLLHYVAKNTTLYPIMQFLIDYTINKYGNKKDIGVQNSNGHTPLYSAIAHRNIHAVQLLLDNGAQITPVIMNIARKNAASFNTEDIEGQIERIINNYKTLNEYPYLFDLPSSIASKTALHLKVENPSSSDGITLSDLIDSRLDINAPDPNGNTPLHLAIMNKNIESINTLVSKRADLELPNKFGHTPLYLAIENRDIEAIKILITAGVVVHLKDMELAKSFENNKDLTSSKNNLIYKLLLAYRPEIASTLPTIVGDTPLHNAAKVNILYPVIQTLISNNCDIDVENAEKQTPLFLAIKYKNLNAVRILLENGARVHEKDVALAMELDTFKSGTLESIISELLQNPPLKNFTPETPTLPHLQKWQELTPVLPL